MVCQSDVISPYLAPVEDRICLVSASSFCSLEQSLDF